MSLRVPLEVRNRDQREQKKFLGTAQSFSSSGRTLAFLAAAKVFSSNETTIRSDATEFTATVLNGVMSVTFGNRSDIERGLLSTSVESAETQHVLRYRNRAVAMSRQKHSSRTAFRLNSSPRVQRPLVLPVVVPIAAIHVL